MATYITIETDKKIAYQIDGGEKQTMFANVDDDGYPEPTGTITITQNGTGIDVKDYAEADVNVPGGGYPEPTGTITITENGTDIDVKDYAAADVAVPTYPEPTGTITITQNGTGIDVKDYAAADVAVPNTYTAGDEGKVVSSGVLVSQTSAEYTTNGTYDTTLKNSVTVNVSGGGTPNNISVSVQNARESGAAVIQAPQYDSTLGTICALNYTINLGNTGTITTIEQNGSVSFRVGFNVSNITYNGNEANWTKHLVSSASFIKIVLPDNYDNTIAFNIL